MKNNTILYDKNFRQRLISDPYQYSKDMGYDLPEGIEIIVKKNTQAITYVAFPDSELNESIINQLQAAGNCTGSVGSAGSASTISSATSTIGSTTSVSTVGTVGSADFT